MVNSEKEKVDKLFVEAKQEIDSLDKAIAGVLAGFRNRTIRIGDAFSDAEDVAYCLASLEFLREHLLESLKEKAKNKKKGETL